MPRTNTTHKSEILRGDVTFAFSQTSRRHVTVVTLPPGSQWSAGAHWHETHTEYLKVVKGTARVRVGSQWIAVTPELGPVEIPRGTIHSWKRDAADSGELVVEEWTDPADGKKEVFFRNLFGAIQDLTSNPVAAPAPVGLRQVLPTSWWVELQVMVISAAHDNYPLFWEGRSGAVLSRPLLLIMAWAGCVFGLKDHYVEYTPSWDKRA